jgi:hypothetical protein
VGKEKQMKSKALMIAALCALAVGLAFPAAGIAAQPTVISLKGSSSGSFSICGLDLTYDFKTSGIEMIRPDGADLSSGEFRSVWTNPATGKGIVIHGAQHGGDSAPVDNGDGTFSVIETADGLYKVSATNGPPISLQAGRVVAKVTFDAVTGEVISVELLALDGPHSTPPADSSCDTIVAALT